MGNFKNYILELEFKITITDNKVDILNYASIEHFDSNKIMVKYQNKLIVINGNNLVVSRLLKDEVLITGNITNIEFR